MMINDVAQIASVAACMEQISFWEADSRSGDQEIVIFMETESSFLC